MADTKVSAHIGFNWSPESELKLRKRQEMLKAYSYFAPKFEALDPERRKAAEMQFFQSYGIHEPSWLKKMLFGSPTEAIMPLPEGVVDRGSKVRDIKRYIVPQSIPFSFTPSPLMQPEHQQEIKKLGKEWGMDEEDQIDLQKRKLGITPDVHEREVSMLRRAEKGLEKARLETPGMTDAYYAEKLPAGIREFWKSRQEDRELKAAQKLAAIDTSESLQEYRKDTTEGRRVAEERKKQEGLDRTTYQKGKLAEGQRKLDILQSRYGDLNKQAALLLKTKGLDVRTKARIELAKTQAVRELQSLIQEYKGDLEMFKLNPNQPILFPDLGAYNQRWDQIYESIMSEMEGPEQPTGPGAPPPKAREEQQSQGNTRQKALDDLYKAAGIRAPGGR